MNPRVRRVQVGQLSTGGVGQLYSGANTLRENIRYGLTLVIHGHPVEDRYLAMQLRAFNDLRLRT